MARGLVVALSEPVKLARAISAFALVAGAFAVGCGRDLQSPGSGAGGAVTGGAGSGSAGTTGAAGGPPGGAGGGSAGAAGCASSGCVTDGGAVDGGGCLSQGGTWVAPGETVTMPPNCGSCTCQASGGFVCDFFPCPKDGEAPRDGGVCTDHKSCNEDPAISVVRGMCLERGLGCHCGMYATSPYTGRCLNPGDDGSGCEYAGTTYGVGAVVPVLGCADRCLCSGPGAIACQAGACLTCVVNDDYSFTLPNATFGYFFRPGDRLSLGRTVPGSDVGRTCSVPLAVCGTPNAFDPSDLFARVSHADVQQALAASPSPVYGDRSLTTAPVFTFRRSAGGSFSVVVGQECSTSSATCEPTPVGIQRLVEDVNAAVAVALADPAGATVR